jgi:hypothetical protein
MESAKTIKLVFMGMGTSDYRFNIFCPMGKPFSRAPKGMDEILRAYSFVTAT